MCNPTLIVAGASAVLQYQVSIQQQKRPEARTARRQNEIALRNRKQKLLND